MPIQSFDPIWDHKYASGHMERYPWDCVVSFVFRNAPHDRPHEEVHLLELGCGTGNNLWFAAREGFQVAGIDGSAKAIEVAKRRFAEDHLSGELVTGDFTQPLPFATERFDLAIDRGAIVCTGFNAAKRTVNEIHRVLKPDAPFLFNPYSQAHTSYVAALADDEELVRDIHTGSLSGVGQLCFYSEAMVRELLADRWTIETLTHIEHRLVAAEDTDQDMQEVYAEWRAVARCRKI